MRWTASQFLRPIVFALSIVAAVMTGNRTDSFWFGLLAFFVGMAIGRALRALVRGDLPKTIYRAIWPAAVVGYAFLFDGLDLPRWATFFVSIIAASMTKTALGTVIPHQRRWQVNARWRWRSFDLDELLP